MAFAATETHLMSHILSLDKKSRLGETSGETPEAPMAVNGLLTSPQSQMRRPTYVS
jgi:hypothetical protein